MDLTYHIDVFEGPLDLLLSLIAKNKMNIADIRITLIFEQYMEYLNQMQQMDMELTGDFIAMAAELMLIKSRMLLPRNEEEEEDPRERLAAALLEYQKAKLAAQFLDGQYTRYHDRFAKDTSEIAADGTILPQDSYALFEAMSGLLERMNDRPQNIASYVAPIIKRKYIPVGTRVPYIVALLKSTEKVQFLDFFSEATTKSELVATFLALLEMIKSGNIRIFYENKDVLDRTLCFALNEQSPLPEIYAEKEETVV